MLNFIRRIFKKKITPRRLPDLPVYLHENRDFYLSDELVTAYRSRDPSYSLTILNDFIYENFQFDKFDFWAFLDRNELINYINFEPHVSQIMTRLDIIKNILNYGRLFHRDALIKIMLNNIALGIAFASCDVSDLYTYDKYKKIIDLLNIEEQEYFRLELLKQRTRTICYNNTALIFMPFDWFRRRLYEWSEIKDFLGDKHTTYLHYLFINKSMVTYTIPGFLHTESVFCIKSVYDSFNKDDQFLFLFNLYIYDFDLFLKLALSLNYHENHLLSMKVLDIKDVQSFIDVLIPRSEFTIKDIRLDF